MSGEDRTEELRQKKEAARQSGGPESIAARRRQGTGSARERVVRLLDPDTFVELDVFIEGVVTGHGAVAGREVYVFSQGGGPSSSDAASGRKLAKVMDMALTNGAPLVGIFDSGVGETATLGDNEGVFLRHVMASGVVPQIAAVVGPVTGAGAFSPALADFVVMTKGAGQLFLGDPASSKTASKGKGLESLGGARVLSEQSGVAHLAADDEEACLAAVREVLSYLPQNNMDDVPLSDSFDPVDRMDEELEMVARSESPQDVRQTVGRVVDKDSFFEIQPLWGKALVAGFARLGGRSIGVVANQAGELDGRLDFDALAKAARFVRLCDAFNLPLVAFVDTVGVVLGEAQGQGRVIREAAKLMYALAEATVPKLSVIIGQAQAEGYELMCSKQVKADFCFAWSTASIGAGPAVAAKGGDADSLYEAAGAGLLDDIIEPVVTRPRLVAALEACVSKRETRPAKKHGNIPL